MLSKDIAIRYNRIFMWFNLVIAIALALLGDAMCFMCFGIAFLNYSCAEYLSKQEEE